MGGGGHLGGWGEVVEVRGGVWCWVGGEWVGLREVVLCVVGGWWVVGWMRVGELVLAE